MTTSSTSALSARTVPHSSSKQFLLASSLVVSALIMAGLGTNRSLEALGNSWIAQDATRIAIAAAATIPAFLACGIMLFAARLLYSSTQHSLRGSRGWSTLAILVALYAPFYWAALSPHWHLLPILPGFTAGLFTRPLDSQYAFIAASGTCTVLLTASLVTIGNRLHHGRYAAPAFALLFSMLASYAAYCFMRA